MYSVIKEKDREMINEFYKNDAENIDDKILRLFNLIYCYHSPKDRIDWYSLVQTMKAEDPNYILAILEIKALPWLRELEVKALSSLRE